MLSLKEIKVLLHHREPYLMVDRVDELSPLKVRGVKIHRGDEAHLAGHFPGAPVVPGAMLQELCTQSAGVLMTRFYSPVEDYDSEQTKGLAIGVLNKVEFAKYYATAKPDADVVADVDLVERMGDLFKFRARVEQCGKVVAKLRFNLVIAPDAVLF
ncbi:MAG: 3-hydroxyacyl-ACP dehydratase FabZ family protein [Coraliomargarita sp.]